LKVTKEKAAEHHEAIILAASRSFRENGFDGVGVIEVMNLAGLTHGAFYGHFQSKAALAAEACRFSFEERLSVWPAGLTLAGFVSGYLSAKHRDQPSHGCPMAAFASSVGHQPAIVKREYARGLESHVRHVTAQFEALGHGKAQARKNATVLLSTLVGGIVMARSVSHTDRRLSDTIISDMKRSIFSQYGL
jgi:TetR/AcrR family transcriptional repressor of nem operon